MKIFLTTLIVALIGGDAWEWWTSTESIIKLLYLTFVVAMFVGFVVLMIAIDVGE